MRWLARRWRSDQRPPTVRANIMILPDRVGRAANSGEIRRHLHQTVAIMRSCRRRNVHDTGSARPSVHAMQEDVRRPPGVVLSFFFASANQRLTGICGHLRSIGIGKNHGSRKYPKTDIIQWALSTVMHGVLILPAQRNIWGGRLIYKHTAKRS
jgi:hypothetical protein